MHAWEPSGILETAHATVLSEWILISCSSFDYFGDVLFLQCSRILLVLDSSPMCLFLLSDIAGVDWKGNTVKGVALPPNSRGVTLETLNFSSFFNLGGKLGSFVFFQKIAYHGSRRV